MLKINFPAVSEAESSYTINPWTDENGQKWIYNSAKNRWTISGGGSSFGNPQALISESAPGNALKVGSGASSMGLSLLGYVVSEEPFSIDISSVGGEATLENFENGGYGLDGLGVGYSIVLGENSLGETTTVGELINFINSYSSTYGVSLSAYSMPETNLSFPAPTLAATYMELVTLADFLGQEVIVGESAIYKCIRQIPVKWVEIQIVA